MVIALTCLMIIILLGTFVFEERSKREFGYQRKRTNSHFNLKVVQYQNVKIVN